MEEKVIKSGDKLYLVKRVIRKEMFAELNDANRYKDFLHCNHVLQNNNMFLFCQTIDDAEIIEEIAL